MNEEEVNNKFADIIQYLDMREIEEEILDEIIIDINELPAIVFMPIITDYGLVYNSFNMPTKHIETFLLWLNSQE
jgi:hypothetical protein|tara:strand:+ start:427 stop:651 length:225 start_codon:yes stop_codon:yes gene_type:complete